MNLNTACLVVDLDADPIIPEGWEVVEHIKGGQVEHTPTTIVLYLDEAQKNAAQLYSGHILGTYLRTRLKSKSPFNVNYGYFLLEHQYLIPEDWKGKSICFWGTIYRDAKGHLFVRRLAWFYDQWRWFFPLCVDSSQGIDTNHLTAVPARLPAAA